MSIKSEKENFQYVENRLPGGLVSISGLRKSFGSLKEQTRVLKEITLEIADGDYVVIRGQSGSGKTTLLRILGLLDRDFLGEFKFKNIDVVDLDVVSRDLLRTDGIGFVFQESRFLSHLTIGENIELPLRLRGIPPEDIAKSLESVSSFVFREIELIRGVLAKRPAQVSGGQQQRAALARAIISSPKLILADEPTASLDPVSRLQVVDKLKELHQAGTTVVIVSHDPVFFDHGRQFELNEGKLAAISDSQQVQPVGASISQSDQVIPNIIKSSMRSWLPKLSFMRLLQEAKLNLLRRPLLSILALMTLLAGILQVAIFLSVLGGVDRIIDQAVSDGSRLNRVLIRPRTIDLQSETRFPYIQEIEEIKEVSEAILRRSTSFSVIDHQGTKKPYQTFGLHPSDPELRYFEAIAGSVQSLSQDEFGIIGTPSFFTDIFGLNDLLVSNKIQWNEIIGREIEIEIPRFNSAGQQSGVERVNLNVGAVILNAENGREFYVSNHLIIASDAIKRDRTGLLSLPLNPSRTGWLDGADISEFLNWPWEDMLHVYTHDIESVLPTLTSLVGFGYRPEAEIWSYIWVLDLKRTALQIFIPVLMLVVIVVSLVLMSNIVISARLREAELALCRVLGMGRGDLLAIELLSVVLLALLALVVGLSGAQLLIGVLSAQLEAQAALVEGITGTGPNQASLQVFSSVIEFAPQLFFGTLVLIVISALLPAIGVARLDPARVFGRQ